MSNTETTFVVTSVRPTNESVRTTTLRAAIARVLTTSVEACSTPEATVVNPYGFHSLIETIHRAYDEHRSLVLSPDDIWLVLSQGFAACVNQDPEFYRSCFVSHEGKELIIIRRDAFVMGAFDNDWRGCFPEFSVRIREYIGDDTHDLILSDFSTTGDIERAASEVVLMDAVQSYFNYEVRTKCGIPSITLRGNSQDWGKVVSKARALLKFGGSHLETWLGAAIPVVEEFAAAARGEVNLNFWQELYKVRDGSGSMYASGFIMRLLPYVKGSKGELVANPLLDRNGNSRGLSVSDLLASISCVPFVWDYLGEKFDYQFLAGHCGISYDAETDSYSPVVGWAVRPKPTVVSKS